LFRKTGVICTMGDLHWAEQDRVSVKPQPERAKKEAEAEFLIN